MRDGLFIALTGFAFPRRISLFAIALITGLVCSCATSPPLRTDLQTVLSDPAAFNNRRVELTGQVIDYEPAIGDTYRTLRFIFGSDAGQALTVFCSGYEADAIAKASILVGEAFEAGGILTVVGTLSAGEGDRTSAELTLESVEYEGRRIDVAGSRKTRSGFEAGGFHIMPSIGIGVTFSD